MNQKVDFSEPCDRQLLIEFMKEAVKGLAAETIKTKSAPPDNSFGLPIGPALTLGELAEQAWAIALTCTQKVIHELDGDHE